jgi:ketosteroid isomerase-like protein
MTDVTDEQIDRLEELEARIDAIESREAIESLHASFVRDVADRRFDELAGYFAPDAVIDMRGHGPRQGTAEIDEHFQGMEAVPLLGAG